MSNIWRIKGEILQTTDVLIVLECDVTPANIFRRSRLAKIHLWCHPSSLIQPNKHFAAGDPASKTAWLIGATLGIAHQSDIFILVPLWSPFGFWRTYALLSLDCLAHALRIVSRLRSKTNKADAFAIRTQRKVKSSSLYIYVYLIGIEHKFTGSELRCHSPPGFSRRLLVSLSVRRSLARHQIKIKD